VRDKAQDLRRCALRTRSKPEIVSQNVSSAKRDHAHHGGALGHALQCLEDRTIASTGEDGVAAGADCGSGLVSGRAPGVGCFDEHFDSSALEDLRDTEHRGRAAFLVGSGNGIEQ